MSDSTRDFFEVLSEVLYRCTMLGFVLLILGITVFVITAGPLVALAHTVFGIPIEFVLAISLSGMGLFGMLVTLRGLSLMGMHNPPHPGEFIREVYLTPYKISARRVAKNLNVSPSTLNRLLKGESNLSPEMALRLSKVLGRSPESWLSMQDQFNLWHARKTVSLKGVKKLAISAA
jgi:addiction module HigA family antidote